MSLSPTSREGEARGNSFSRAYDGADGMKRGGGNP